MLKCFTLGDLNLDMGSAIKLAEPEILGRNLNGGVFVLIGQGDKVVSVLARSMGAQGFLTHRIADIYAIREVSLYQKGDDLALIPPLQTDVWPQALVALTLKSGYGGYVKPGIWTTGDEISAIAQVIYKHSSSLNDTFEGQVAECLLTLRNHGSAHVDVLDSLDRNWRYSIHFVDGEGVTATVAMK